MPLSIASILPNTSSTGGRRLVTIRGTGFRLAPPPPAVGVTPAPPVTVRVYFGTREAKDVRVLSETRLDVITPSLDPGVYPVHVVNVDPYGAPDENVTLAGAFTFAMPKLERLPRDESILQRISRTMLQELKRQVLGNVEMTVSTDYDDTPDGANVAMLTTVPGLVLSGPSLSENRMSSLNARRRVTGPNGEVRELRTGRTVDVTFTIIGVDDNSQRVLGLMQETSQFFDRNRTISMLRNPRDPHSDYVEYEVEIAGDGDMKWTGGPGNSNIRSFSGSFVVRGVDLDEDDMQAGVVPMVREVVPNGSVQPASPVVLLGQPGVVLPGPLPSVPVAVVGTDGPIVQIPPEEENE